MSKKKNTFLWRLSFQVFVYIRIRDLDDLSSANSIKSGYTLGQILIMSFEFLSEKNSTSYEKRALDNLWWKFWEQLFTLNQQQSEIQSKNK